MPFGLNPTSALSGAIRAAELVQMKENKLFSFFVERNRSVQRL
jgi:hypothetical protein